jgi:hypothetical protein
MTQATNNGTSLMIQGRLVWTVGKTLFEGQVRKDQNTHQIIYGEDGQPVMSYGFGLAIPKIDPRTGQPTEIYKQVWEALHREAFTLYPSGHLPPQFAMKYKDGDGVDHNGQPFANREGHANHLILACTTQIPFKCFRWEGGNNIVVNDGIKCGDYVNVQLNIKAHPAKGQGKPGLYLNPSAVQLIQAGKEIINTPSGDQIFGMTAPAYAGQVVAPEQAAMPNYGQAPAPMPGMTPQQQQYNAMAPAPTAAPVPAAQPHYGVLPTHHQPAVAPAPMPGYPAQGNGYTPAGAPPVAMPTHGTHQAPATAPAAFPSNGGMPAMPGMPR